MSRKLLPSDSDLVKRGLNSKQALQHTAHLRLSSLLTCAEASKSYHRWNLEGVPHVRTWRCPVSGINVRYSSRFLVPFAKGINT